jgi:hypothetical protein
MPKLLSIFNFKPGVIGGGVQVDPLFVGDGFAHSRCGIESGPTADMYSAMRVYSPLADRSYFRRTEPVLETTPPHATPVLGSHTPA